MLKLGLTLRLLFLLLVVLCAAEKLTYVNFEHPVINYYDPKYYANISITLRRIKRGNPIYYGSVSLTSLDYFGNNVSMHFYFYEWLSNTYKRGFIEYHGRACDLLENDMVYGYVVKKKFHDMGLTCPFPPGHYHLENMTLPPTSIPKGFPFTKGRIYVNVTLHPQDKIICSGHVDMELRQLDVRKKNLFDVSL